MSTVKTDAITAVSTNGDLSLDGIGTGGVSIASTLKMTKGGDISSASPLVIDTDGNYFDVTGTTNFAAMTVEEGNFFMLQFDGALTVTDGSSIVLPGNANITTAAGDVWTCYATAANTVVVISIETTAAASSPALSFVSTTVASDDATIDITFTPGDADLFIVEMQGVKPASDGVFFHARTTTDASSFDSGAANYTSQTFGVNGTQEVGSGPTSATSIAMTASPADTGSTGEEHLNGTVKIFKPSDTGLWSTIGWDLYLLGSSGTPGYPSVAKGVGYRYSAADIDGIQFYFASGNVEVGRFTLYKQVQS